MEDRSPRKLTNRNVKALKPDPDGKQYVIRDTEQEGFFVVIGRHAKTYTVQYDIPTEIGRRKSTRKALGKFGEINADDARKLASDERTGIATKRIKITQGDLSLGEAWATYRQALSATGTAQSTIAHYETVYRLHLSQWDGEPLRKLHASPLVVADHWRELGAKTPSIANQAMKLLKAIYKAARTSTLGRSNELPPGSPTDGIIRWFPSERRNNALKLEDFAAWNCQREALPCAIRREFHLFVLLSGGRPSALAQARWSWFDEEDATLRFPGSAMKGGREFVLPLSKPMLACLGRLRHDGEIIFGAQPFIFPAHSASGHLSRAKERNLSHVAGQLRQCWATVAKGVMGGYEARLLLNHSAKDQHAGYEDTDTTQAPVREAQEKMSAILVEALQSPDGDLDG